MSNYLERLPLTYRDKGDASNGEVEIVTGGGIAYEDRFVMLVKDRVLFPSGSVGDYIRLVAKSEMPFGVSGVAVLPIFNGKIVLRKEFRHATRSWELEIVRGFHDSDSSLEDSAKREIHEELGFSIRTLKMLGSIHPDSGMLTSTVVLYYAELDKSIGTLEEDTEALGNYVYLNKDQFRSEVIRGTIKDSFSICAFMFADAYNLF